MTAVQSVIAYESSAPTFVTTRGMTSKWIISVSMPIARSQCSPTLCTRSARHEDNGMYIPDKLGEGRFCQVYKCWQRSDGQNLRLVAIKILQYRALLRPGALYPRDRSPPASASVNTKSKAVKILTWSSWNR